jgi:undecaprenyl-diphosphatase
MNYELTDALNDLSGQSRFFDDLMIFAAKDLIYLAFVLFALALVPVVRRRAWGVLTKVGATLGLAFVLGLLAAALYAEPRPFTRHHEIRLLVSHSAGQSFPSDHATASFAIGFAVLVFVSRAWGGLLVALAVVVGVARVYTGVHYAGDILGSLAVVLIALAAVSTASRLAPHHPAEPSGTWG